MDILSLLVGCGISVSVSCKPATETQKTVSQWQPMVSQAASLFDLPQAWVNAVIAQESGGRNTLGGRPITSKAGAMGLMQLMPKTYAELQRQYGLGADAYAPHDNILAGTAYLRKMYTRYGYPNMFAAYNAGPGRFDDYLLGRKPLPGETISYLSAIVPGAESSLIHREIVPPRINISQAKNRIFIERHAPAALFVTLSIAQH